MITYQPKAFENPNTVDIKSFITEYSKTSQKLSNAIRQAEKQVIIALYIVIQEKVKKLKKNK